MKILSFITLLFLSFNTIAADIKIEEAKIRLVPPTSTVSAIFLKITNKSNQDIKLISAESDLAKSVELHDMIMDNGGMRMRQVQNINLKANSTTELKRGGLHIMLIDLKNPLKEGSSHKIKLNFDDKTNQTIEVKVQTID
jgi:copper(I)-binding protein